MGLVNSYLNQTNSYLNQTNSKYSKEEIKKETELIILKYTRLNDIVSIQFATNKLKDFGIEFGEIDCSQSIICCCVNGNYEILKFLWTNCVYRGCKINKHIRECIEIAIKNENMLIIDFLFKKRYSFNGYFEEYIFDHWHQFFIQPAIKNNKINVLSWFKKIQCDKFEEKDISRELSLAVSVGHPEVLNWIFDNINQRKFNLADIVTIIKKHKHEHLFEILRQKNIIDWASEKNIDFYIRTYETARHDFSHLESAN